VTQQLSQVIVHPVTYHTAPFPLHSTLIHHPFSTLLEASCYFCRYFNKHFFKFHPGLVTQMMHSQGRLKTEPPYSQRY